METPELRNNPSNSRLISEIREFKISPLLFPGLEFVLVRSQPEKIELIKLILNKYHGTTFEMANRNSRKGKYVRYRHHFMFLLLKYTNYSLKGVGRELGRNKDAPMDHSTIVYGRDTWQRNIDQNYKGSAKIHKAVVSDIDRLLKTGTNY